VRRALIIFAVWAGSVILAASLGHKLFYNLAYLITATIVLSYIWARANMASITLERVTRTKRAQVGRYIDESFVMRNRGMFPKLWIEVNDKSNLPAHQISRVISSLGAYRSRGWTVHTLCLRRGRFTLGPITLSSGDAFGLFRMSRKLPETSSVVVYPSMVDLPGFEARGGELPGGDAVRRRTHYVTTNASGVRDYVPGDSFNRIHWPSTARTGRLVVKEFELDPTTDVWIFLDAQSGVQTGSPLVTDGLPLSPAVLWKTTPGSVLDPSTEEYGVVIAASLAKHFLARNRAVGLLVYGQERESVQPDRGERQLNKILETLAVLRAIGQMPFHEMLSVEASSLPRGSTIVAVTPSTDVLWVHALRELRRRGLRSVAVHIDASSFDRAPSPDKALAELAGSQIPAYSVRNGVPLSISLSEMSRVGRGTGGKAAGG
jgi:uncharacterized protein (DUF58 family)